jgi:S1-C subfamily serine protease
VSDPRDAVVKIFNTRQRPGWTVPWQSQPVESSTGSGAVIAGDPPAVLTAAHVVADSRHLQLQRSTDRFSSERFRARIAAICHDVDLALLEVTDPAALHGIAPLELSSSDALPRVFDKVHVVGYPVGGDAVSVTEGVVSRVEVQEYSHSLRPGLALTVDAAINSGNSGGPLLDAESSRILGVAFQKLVARGVELQGHAVPAPLIHRFLHEARLDRSANCPRLIRMPSLGCDYQSLEPAALRESLGLGKQHGGVLVNRVHHTGNGAHTLPISESQSIQSGDVLLAFDGLPLDNLGFCDLLGRRLHFAAARDLRRMGANVILDVWRDGRMLTVSHELKPTQHLVPRGQYDCKPAYFIVGGLVFQPLSHEYLQGWNVGERPPHLQRLFLGGHLTPDRSEVVMLAQVLADQVNAGYDSGWVGAPVVEAINGQTVRSLAHLAEVVDGLRSGKDGYLRFDVQMSGGPFRIVLSLHGLSEADARIEEVYGIPARLQPA